MSTMAPTDDDATATPPAYAMADLGGCMAPRDRQVGKPPGLQAVRKALRAVIDAEGPVLEDVAFRRVLEAWAIKPSPGKLAWMRKAAHGRATSSDTGRCVLWPSGSAPVAMVAFRPSPGGTRRPCHEVPMPELVGLASTIPGDNERSRQRAMAGILGHVHVTSAVHVRLETAVRIATALGPTSTTAGISAIRACPGTEAGATFTMGTGQG